MRARPLLSSLGGSVMFLSASAMAQGTVGDLQPDLKSGTCTNKWTDGMGKHEITVDPAHDQLTIIGEYTLMGNKITSKSIVIGNDVRHFADGVETTPSAIERFLENLALRMEKNAFIPVCKGKLREADRNTL